MERSPAPKVSITDLRICSAPTLALWQWGHLLLLFCSWEGYFSVFFLTWEVLVTEVLVTEFFCLPWPLRNSAGHLKQTVRQVCFCLLSLYWAPLLPSQHCLVQATSSHSKMDTQPWKKGFYCVAPQMHEAPEPLSRDYFFFLRRMLLATCVHRCVSMCTLTLMPSPVPAVSSNARVLDAQFLLHLQMTILLLWAALDMFHRIISILPGSDSLSSLALKSVFSDSSTHHFGFQLPHYKVTQHPKGAAAAAACSKGQLCTATMGSKEGLKLHDSMPSLGTFSHPNPTQQCSVPTRYHLSSWPNLGVWYRGFHATVCLWSRNSRTSQLACLLCTQV